ncbi:unnamed protein product, partial [Polarella glacialis]
ASSANEEALAALNLVLAILQASDSSERAATLIEVWPTIVAGVPAEDSLKVLPGNLRKSAAAVLDQQGLDRASRQDCVVILDAALKEAAKTLPRLVSKVSGRLGGLPVAAKGKGTGRTADAGPMTYPSD